MSTRVFPTLPSLLGMAYPVSRGPLFSTNVQRSISGKRVAIAKWLTPLWQWELDINILRSLASPFDWQMFVDFYEQSLGPFDTWLWSDPEDNTTTGEQFGLGNASTLAFQLGRRLKAGGFIEPVFAPNIVYDVYVAGVPVPGVGLAAPSAPALSDVAGGAIGATTYFVKVTLATPSGESSISSESSRAVGANRLLRVTAPAGAGAAFGWNVYVSTTTNTETRQNSSPIALGTAWTEPTTGLISGVVTPTVANSFGLGSWGSANPGVVTFTNPPANAAALTSDLSFYFPCAFEDDKLSMQQINSGRFNAKKLKFISIK